MKNAVFYLAIVLFMVFQVTSINRVYAGSDGPQQSPKKLFRAGATTTNISPSMAVEMRSSATIENIHDELHARCLVLDDGEKQLAFIVVDIIGRRQKMACH